MLYKLCIEKQHGAHVCSQVLVRLMGEKHGFEASVANTVKTHLEEEKEERKEGGGGGTTSNKAQKKKKF